MAPRLTTCILVTPVLPTPHTLAEVSVCSHPFDSEFQSDRANLVILIHSHNFDAVRAKDVPGKGEVMSNPRGKR